MGALVNNNQIIRIDSNLLLDPTMCDAYMDGAYLCLTPNEFNILFCMAQKPGHAFSRQELFVAAFGHDDPKSHRVLDSHIKNIRKKLKEDARNARWLKGVHGYGYRLDFAPGFEPEVSVGEGGRVFRSAHGDRVLVVDSVNRIVQHDGEELALTPIEHSVLNALTARSNVEISNEELSQISMGVGFAESNRALASHVKNLRKKLGDEVKNPLWIKTVHGFGYRFLGVDETPAPREEQMLDDSLIELSEQLQMAFDTTSGSVLLWHDVGGAYADVVERLLLPDDVVLIREDVPADSIRFELLTNSASMNERCSIGHRRALSMRTIGLRTLKRVLRALSPRRKVIRSKPEKTLLKMMNAGRPRQLRALLWLKTYIPGRSTASVLIPDLKASWPMSQLFPSLIRIGTCFPSLQSWRDARPTKRSSWNCLPIKRGSRFTLTAPVEVGA